MRIQETKRGTEMTITRNFTGAAALLLAAVLAAGCGMIADQDMKVLAQYVDGDGNLIEFRQADLFQHLRKMDDDKRPRIRQKDDYRRVIEKYIDNAIKRELARQMRDEGLPEVSRDYAREQFFRQSGDDEQMYRTIWRLNVDADNGVTGLMTTYKLTPEHVRRAKEMIELETDDLIEEIQAEMAVALLARKALEAGELTVPEEDLEREYELQKNDLEYALAHDQPGNELLRFEQIEFRGFRFPAGTDEGRAEASAVRERIDNGEDFDAIVDEYLVKNPSVVAESVIENNPDSQPFRNFWMNASGAQPGDILGPVFMPEFTQQGMDAQGRPMQRTVEESFFVFKVLNHREAGVLTFEEAKPRLRMPLLYNAEMERLREEHEVVIYEDRIPSPTSGARTF